MTWGLLRRAPTVRPTRLTPADAHRRTPPACTITLSRRRSLGLRLISVTTASTISLVQTPGPPHPPAHRHGAWLWIEVAQTRVEETTFAPRHERAAASAARTSASVAAGIADRACCRPDACPVESCRCEWRRACAGCSPPRAATRCRRKWGCGLRGSRSRDSRQRGCDLRRASTSTTLRARRRSTARRLPAVPAPSAPYIVGYWVRPSVVRA